MLPPFAAEEMLGPERLGDSPEVTQPRRGRRWRPQLWVPGELSSLSVALSEAKPCLHPTASLCVLPAQGQEGAGGDGTQEGPRRRDAVPRGPGPGDEAEAHTGRRGAHGAAGAVQEGTSRSFRERGAPTAPHNHRLRPGLRKSQPYETVMTGRESIY